MAGLIQESWPAIQQWQIRHMICAPRRIGQLRLDISVVVAGVDTAELAQLDLRVYQQ